MKDMNKKITKKNGTLLKRKISYLFIIFSLVILIVLAYSIKYSFSIDDNNTTYQNTQNQIHFVSVGWSDAYIIESNGHYGLIDASNPVPHDESPQGEEVTKESETVLNLVNYMSSLLGEETKLDFIIATHSHSDHIGGMRKIAEYFVNSNTKYYYREYEDTIDDREHPEWGNRWYYEESLKAMGKILPKENLIEVTNQEIEFPFEAYTIKLLNTAPVSDDETILYTNENGETEALARGENKNSIVTLVKYKNNNNIHKVLFNADMESEDEQRLIQNMTPEELEEISNVDVMTAGHHGNSSSSTLNYIKIINPENIIITRNNFIFNDTTAVARFAYAKEFLRLHNGYGYIPAKTTSAIILSYDGDNYTLHNADLSSNLDAARIDFNVEKNGNLINVSNENNKTVTFYLENDTLVTGWKQIMGENNELNWYYFDTKSNLMKKESWLTYGGNDYYLDSDGVMVKGWKEIEGKRYYFNSDGTKHKGWLIDGEEKYYLDSDGAMVTGWKEIDSKWYYFNSDGTMHKGWLTEGEEKYYLNSDGVMITGWKEEGGNKYYFRENGAMCKNWREIDGYWYYFDDNGIMLTGWLTEEGKKYYLDSNGVMVKGKYTIDGNDYYFRTRTNEFSTGKNGSMVTGLITIDGKKYYYNEEQTQEFGAQGALVKQKCKLFTNNAKCFDENGELIDIDIEKVTTYKVKKDYLTKIQLNTQISTIKNIDKYEFKVFNGANEKSPNEKIGTSNNIKIYLYNYNVLNYTAVVKGDVTGTGNVSISDVAKLYQHLKGKIKMDGEFVEAGNVVSTDNEIKVNDVAKLYQFVKGKINSLED